ncbi:type II secretion system protein N [Rhodoferax aquaticus]|uniref:Type II secretion system protein N n=2 Tax=Rhodoferax aquaticus TaxID=2527691 RepID=A0A515EVE7_9BURK|nr:type II secretion system protein N [Rhodoferax aquaticus]
MRKRPSAAASLARLAPARTRPSTPSSSRAPWAWLICGLLLGLLLCTLVFAPARWLAGAVSAISQDRVQLRAPQGTVWQGSAQLLLSAGADSVTSTQLPSRLQWRLRPHADGFALDLAADCCLSGTWQWTITPHLDGLTLRLGDLSPSAPLHWPAALLTGLGTPWNTLQLQGEMQATVQQFALQMHGNTVLFTGQLQLDALDLSTSLSTLKPMGSYRVQLLGTQQGRNTPPTLTLSTLQGELQLQGQGDWSQGHLRFNGEASASPERMEAMGNLLNIIGRRDGTRSLIQIH